MAAPQRENFSWLQLSVIWISLFILVTLFFLALWFRMVNWQLNLVAQTETVRLSLLSSQQWILGDALVCVRRDANQLSREGASDRCGSRWHEVVDGIQQPLERYLHLKASTEDPINVKFDVGPTGIKMAISRSSTSDQGLGALYAASTTQENVVELAKNIIVSWSWSNINKSREIDDNDVLVFPFVGAVNVGSDVSWSTRNMLISGDVLVFSASDSHLAGRVVAEQSALTLGDRVDANFVPGTHHVMPKGFMRIDRMKASRDQQGIIEVVAFSPAEQVVIHRYGGGEYLFEASWWVRLKHQSWLVIAIVLFTGIVSILNSTLSIRLMVPKFRSRRSNPNALNKIKEK